MKIIVILFCISLQTTPLLPTQLIEHFPPALYKGHRQNWAVTHDNRGIVYFANPGGILQFDSNTWRLIPLGNGDGAYSLTRGPLGKIYAGGRGEIGYIAAHGKGTLRFRSLKKHLPPAYRDFQARVVKIRVLPPGIVCLTDKLIFIINRTTGKTSVLTAGDHFYTFHYCRGNLYVIDSGGGLLKLYGGKLVPVPGGASLRAHVMLTHREHQLLIVTTQEGPVRFDPHAPAPSMTPLQQIDHHFFTDNLVTCGIRLDDNRVALGSVDKGVLIMGPGGSEITHLHRGAGLPDNTVYGLHRDGRGNTWLALDNGIALLPAGTDTPEKKKKTPFSAFIRECRRFSDDTLVFGGAFYSRENTAPLPFQPKNQILTFPFHDNAFRFTCASNNYRDISGTRYQYVLEGLDRGWSKWTRRAHREYTNLDPGTYTFRVAAYSRVWGTGREAAYTFHIRSPWHKSRWFLAAQILFILILLIVTRLIATYRNSQKLSDYLIIFVWLILFGYLKEFFNPIIGKYSAGIGFFKIIITVTLAVMLKPIQGFFRKAISKIPIHKNPDRKK